MKQTRNERIFQKTKKHLSKEIDIVGFLKFMREVKALIKFSVSQEDQEKYLKPKRYSYVNSDGETESTLEEKIITKIYPQPQKKL